MYDSAPVIAHQNGVTACLRGATWIFRIWSEFLGRDPLGHVISIARKYTRHVTPH